VNHPLALAPLDVVEIKQVDELEQPAPKHPIVSSFTFDAPNLVCIVEHARSEFLEIMSELNELVPKHRILLSLLPEHVDLVWTDPSILVAVFDHVPLGVTLGVRRGAAFVRSSARGSVLRSAPRLVSVGLRTRLSGSAGGEGGLVSTRRLSEMVWDVAIRKGNHVGNRIISHVSQGMGVAGLISVWERQK
jgi:hypothetical protein